MLMICPYCDRVLADAQELSNCPHCGGNLPACQDPEELHRTVAKTLTFPNPPIGKYQDADGYLEIGTDSVTFLRKPFLKEHKRVVFFRDLFAVSYSGGNAVGLGFLCVREWKDRHIPLISKDSDAALDETSFLFKVDPNNDFMDRAYTFLNRCCKIIHDAHPEWKQNKLLLLMGQYKGSYGYMELGKDAVIFSKDLPGIQKIHRLIPFQSIVDVKLEVATTFKHGGLWVMERQDLAPSAKSIAANVDSNAIDFPALYNEQMQKVYAYLKQLAESNRQSSAFAQTQQKKAELEAAGTLFCPACLATSVQSVRVPKPYIHRPLSVRDPKLSILSNSIYLTRMAIRSAEPETFQHTCSSCGHQWTSK